MNEWHRILQKVLLYGDERKDRTGVGTFSLFGEQLEFENNDKNFPAVTTKLLAFRQVAAELSCFLHGDSNLAQFHARGCTIWDGNANSNYWLPKSRCIGDLGRIYGVQWRDWLSTYVPKGKHAPEDEAVMHTDQLRELVDGIKLSPHSRRHLVTAWNPGELAGMCLPPCHVLFQAYVADGNIDLRVDMRSVDLFLGLPFDIASYALLQRLLAKELGLKSRRLVFQLGDAHIYLNHLTQVETVLSREPLEPPSLYLDPKTTLFDFEIGHARLEGYQHLGSVVAPLNV